MSADRLKNILGKTYGGESRVLNLAFDSFHNVNGGSLSGCLQNNYQKDFVTDLKMMDTVRSEIKD